MNEKLINIQTITYDADLWQLVPINPTEKMYDKANKYLNTVFNSFLWAYKAMLQAAPKPPIVKSDAKDKLKIAIEALQAECGNRCNAENNPCAAKQALEKIGE